MIRTFLKIKTLIQIIRTIARYDALFFVERNDTPIKFLNIIIRLITFGVSITAEVTNLRNGEKLALALQNLGPGFIKLGQALSVRPDLIGQGLADDLNRLQDRLPPFSSKYAKQAIENEFEKSLDKIFKTFDETPVAAASIAQVHFATTLEDIPVAVKILRPGIEEKFDRELDLLYWLASILEGFAPNIRRLRPIEVVDTLSQTVFMEMDLRLEAAASDELRLNFENDPSFNIPKMDWSRTGKRVLTSERISGTPIDEISELNKNGLDVEKLVANMARTFFLQVFRDGFFHADLHPGNILVSEDGVINIIDFGIMGRVDKKTRYYLAEMLIGFIEADYTKVAKAHVTAGYLPTSKTQESFAQAARAIAEPIMGLPLKEISLARLLEQLFLVAQRFEMETQPQLLLLQKTMLVAEGVGRQLYPETNMWELAKPLIEEWVEKNLTQEFRAKEAMSEAGRVIEHLPSLIINLSESVKTIGQRGLKLDQDTTNTMSKRKPISRWSWWIGAALVMGFLIISN